MYLFKIIKQNNLNRDYAIGIVERGESPIKQALFRLRHSAAMVKKKK